MWEKERTYKKTMAIKRVSMFMVFYTAEDTYDSRIANQE